MSKRVYTPTEREHACLRAQQIGQAAAGRELGIPSGTINYWQSMARKRAGSRVLEPAVQSENPPLVEAPSVPQRKASKVVARVAKVYTPSERARTLEHAAAEGVTAAAKKFGISRFTIYEWQRRVELHAQGKAADSPVVGSDENHAALRDQRILAVWRAHPGLGPSQVRNQLRRQGFKVSVHTVRCVLENDGYVPPKVRRMESDGSYEAVRPNQLWHLDFLHRHVHKQKVFVLLLLDDWLCGELSAKLWYGWACAAMRQGTVIAAKKARKIGVSRSKHKVPMKQLSTYRPREGARKQAKGLLPRLRAA